MVDEEDYGKIIEAHAHIGTWSADNVDFTEDTLNAARDEPFTVDINGEEEENEVRVDEASLSIDPVSAMDEIIPEIDEDIPPREYDEIENDLSLEEMEEEEAEDEDEEDEE